MAYRSFSDILSQAQRQSRLRGQTLPTSAVRSMGAGYFADAFDASQTDRAANLAQSQFNLAEKAQTATEAQNKAILAQNADLFAKTLAMQKSQEEAQMEAAEKAQLQGNIGTGLQAGTLGASLLKGTDTGNAIVNLGKTALGKITGISAPSTTSAFTAGEAAIDGTSGFGTESAGNAFDVGSALAAEEAAAGQGGWLMSTGAADALAGKTAGTLTAAGVGSSTAGSIGSALGGAAYGISNYAAPAILAREGLSAILSNQSSPVAYEQGKLMKEPTFEGLIGAAGKRIAEHFDVGQGDMERMQRVAHVMDPVGSLMKGETEDIKDATGSVLSAGMNSLFDNSASTTEKAANILTGGLAGAFLGFGKNDEPSMVDKARDYTILKGVMSGDYEKFKTSGNANRLFWNILSGKAWEPETFEGVNYSNNVF